MSETSAPTRSASTAPKSGVTASWLDDRDDHARRRRDGGRAAPEASLVPTSTPALVPTSTPPLVPASTPTLVARAMPPPARAPEASVEEEAATEEREAERHGELAARGGIAVPLPPPTGGAGARLQRSSLPELFVAMVTPDREEAGGLLVEDDARTMTGGQMHKGEFMRLLREEVCRVAEEELRRAGRSAQGCPYIEEMLSYYQGRSAEHLERAIRRYAPATRRVRSAREYLPILAARLGHGIAQWATTGRMPEDVPNEALAAMAGARTGIVGMIAGIAGIGPARKGVGPEPDRVDAGALVRQLGPGQPLDASTQGRMERALGHSFAGVRIHADDTAAALSHDLAARAFTLGPHVAFGAGELRPGTPEGDALIAHELAHVVQQGTTSPAGEVPVGATADPLEHDADLAAIDAVATLHRDELHPADAAPPRRSRWRALSGALRLQRCSGGARTAADLSTINTPPPATMRSGFEITEPSNREWSNPRVVFFERGSSVPSGTEIDEIQAAVQYENTPDSLRRQPIDIHGYRSEDEPAELAGARAQHVAELFQGWGHDAARNVVAEPSAGVGRPTYRELRKVEVVNAGAQSSVPTSPTRPCTTADNDRVDANIDRARTLIGNAITAVSTPTAANVRPAFTGIFGDPTDAALVSQVSTNYDSLSSFLHTHVRNPANRECGTELHPACGGGAGAGFERNSRITTFCPSSFTETGDRVAFTLMHEASHGAPWQGARTGHSTEDFAYRWMRVIGFLRPETTAANADSYVLFSEWLESRTPLEPEGTRPSMGHVAGDPHPTLTGTEGIDAERALAYTEQRVMFAHQVMRNVYNNLVRLAGGSDVYDDPDHMWQRVAPAIFPHRDPAVPPVQQDVYEAAGILDRLTTQYDKLRTSDEHFRMNRVTGNTNWWSGPGRIIDVGNDFRAAAGNHEEQAQIFLRQLVRATPTIDESLRGQFLALYEAARLIRGGTTAP